MEVDHEHSSSQGDKLGEGNKPADSDDNDNSGQPVLQGVDDDGGRSGGMNSSTAGLGSPRGEDEGVEKVSDDDACLEEQAQQNFEDERNSLEAVSDCSEDEGGNPGKVPEGGEEGETCPVEESNDSTFKTSEQGLSKDKSLTNDDDRDASVSNDADKHQRDPIQDDNDNATAFPEDTTNAGRSDGAVTFEDERHSLDAVSESSEIERNVKKGQAEDNQADPCSAAGVEESNDSKTSDMSKDKVARDNENEANNDENSMSNFLMAHESIMEEDEVECVETEVDITSMMEVNMDMDDDSDSQRKSVDNLNTEPEVIPLDSDDDMPAGGQNRNMFNQLESGEASEPVLLNVDQRIFQIDDDENVTEMDISSMMEVEVGEPPREEEPSPSTSRRPRRAAAEQAAKTIHAISADEAGVPSNVFRTRRKSQEDTDFNVEDVEEEPSPKQKCFICKKTAACTIVIRQYGSDVFLCSNNCFNNFRNRGTDCRGKSLPCAKCGILDASHASASRTTYYWETMNFCTELCVGRYQMDVGSQCVTCAKNVPWNSLGKYCVRFGSDIRQFCTPSCLEGYKKSARVCFNCQLDIRRVGNVVLANIPSKNTPKEFCSNDCVEMYCDRNLHQPTRAKPVPEHACIMCGFLKPVHKELVIVKGNFKICSEACWQELLRSQEISKAEKCEMCPKYVNMDLGYTTPHFWLSSVNKIVGFCSHVCKNLYILNNRKILACTSCKVKKYNYDLVEYFANGSSKYAVCSLACLPKPGDFLKNIREVLYLPQPTSDRSTLSAFGNGASHVITSVTSESGKRSRRKVAHSTRNAVNDEVIEIDDDEEDDGSDMEIGPTDNILDILTIDEIEEVLELIKKHADPPKVRHMMCYAKPKTRSIETQTDISELNDMDRIPLKTPDEVVHYIPVPIPTLVHVPFPGYFVESPVPVPFPLPIPVPIPIPVIFEDKKEGRNSETDEDDKGKGDDDEKDKEGGSRDNTSAKEPPHSSDDGRRDGDGGGSRKQSDTSTSQINSPGTSDHQQRAQSLSRSSSRSPAAIKHDRLPTDSSSCLHARPPGQPPEVTQSRDVPPGNQGKVMQPHADSIYNRRTIPAQPPVTAMTSLVDRMCPQPSVVQPFATPPTTPLISHPIENLGYGNQQLPAPKPIQPPSYPAYPYDQRNFSSIGMGMNPMNLNMSPSVPPASALCTPATPMPYRTHSPTFPGMTSAPVPHPMSMCSSAITPKNSRMDYALRAWKSMFGPSSDPRLLNSVELSSKLSEFVMKGIKPNGEKYRADILLYICLGIQQLLRDNRMVDKLFYDNVYYKFVLAFTEFAERERTVGINGLLEETHFWETSELGATSPGVLLFTLIYMFQKHFGLKNWEMHAGLQFHNIILQSRYDQYGRFSKFLSIVGVPGANLTEVQENNNSPDKCVVKLYEFYCFKSEIREGSFYKCLRIDYTPRSPWFTLQNIDKRFIYQMLVRASMIRSEDGFS